jgi:hypothetical protein
MTRVNVYYLQAALVISIIIRTGITYYINIYMQMSNNRQSSTRKHCEKDAFV